MPKPILAIKIILPLLYLTLAGLTIFVLWIPGRIMYHGVSDNLTLRIILITIIVIVFILTIYFLFIHKKKRAYQKFVSEKILSPSRRILIAFFRRGAHLIKTHSRFLWLIWKYEPTRNTIFQDISICWEQAAQWQTYYRFEKEWNPFYMANLTELLTTDIFMQTGNQIWLETLASLFGEADRMIYPQPSVISGTLATMNDDLRIDFYEALLQNIDNIFRLQAGVKGSLTKSHETLLNNLLGTSNLQRVNEIISEKVSLFLGDLKSLDEMNAMLSKIDPERWKLMFRNLEVIDDKEILLSTIEAIIRHNKQHTQPELIYKGAYTLLAEKKRHQAFTYYIEYCRLCDAKRIAPDNFDGSVAEQILQNSSIDRRNLMEIFDSVKLNKNYNQAIAEVKVITNRRFGPG
ncbi:MAG: hypothetical protein ACOYNC_01025 [Bacteroidales bacterium]